MKREFQPSQILGAPYYELSTYTIETWVADKDNPFYSLYQRQNFKGVDVSRVMNNSSLYLFLKVSHILTRSAHKNGTYSEPERSEVEKFAGVIRDVVNGAVVKVCSTLRGR